MNEKLQIPGGVTARMATLALMIMCVFSAAGCTNKAPDAAEAKRNFLAPTDVNKLTPEARAHLPGGGKFQPTGTPKKP